MDEFRKLGIIEPILKTLQEKGFEKPSEIQEKAIPLVLNGRDVIAGAATGSGKTLAFAAGILRDVDPGKGLQGLILTPTRELAEQITTALKFFSKHCPRKIISVYGGVSINPQISGLKKADIVVGTPGRMLDHLSRGTINLKKIKILVLDEADRMLDMGFIDDVDKIVRKCPQKRQTLLFSATISSDIDHLSKKYMRHPVEVSAESYVDPKKLSQVYYDVPANLKFSLLVHLLKHEKTDLVMVFCNTQKGTSFVANNLKKLGINALAIHGGFSQAKRSNTLERFHSKNIHVLVCTDVAARGLDIPGVSHVYNYDIPKEPKAYVHRIGRTARAGEEGKAINLVSSRDYDSFSEILNRLEIKIEPEKAPFVKRVEIQWEEGSRRGRSIRRFKERSGRGDNRRSSSRDRGRKPFRRGSDNRRKRPERGRRRFKN